MSVAARLQATDVFPLGLAGLALWVEGDLLPSPSDGAALATWNDGSGNARNVGQGTGTKQPLAKTGANGINNLPVVRFDGSNDFMTDGTTLTLTSGFTIALVLKPVAVAVASICSVFDGGAQSRMQFIQLADGSLFNRVLTNSTNYIGRTTATGEMTNGTAVVLVVDYDGGTVATGLRVFKNGTQIDTTTANAGTFTSAASSTKAFEVASQQSGGAGVCFNGDYATIQIWLRKLTDTERGQLTHFLGPKYGITVS